MFGFGFALVPIYNVFCEITGLNRSFETASAVSAVHADTLSNRLLTVELISADTPTGHWSAKALQSSLQVKPGQLYNTEYAVTNRSDRDVVGQAIPSVLPIQAAKYLQKTECFCFTPQSFAAGETRNLPMRFYVDPALPNHIETITISYQFLDSSDTINSSETRGRLL